MTGVAHLMGQIIFLKKVHFHPLIQKESKKFVQQYLITIQMLVRKARKY